MELTWSCPLHGSVLIVAKADVKRPPPGRHRAQYDQHISCRNQSERDLKLAKRHHANRIINHGMDLPRARAAHFTAHGGFASTEYRSEVEIA